MEEGRRRSSGSSGTSGKLSERELDNILKNLRREGHIGRRRGNTGDTSVESDDEDEETDTNINANVDWWNDHQLELDVLDPSDTIISGLRYPVDLADMEIVPAARKGMVIDEVTMRNLNLHELVEAFDKTQTDTGHRMLEYLVHFPLRDIKEINKRASAIKELADTPQLMDALYPYFSSMAISENGFTEYCFPQQGDAPPRQETFLAARMYLAQIPHILSFLRQAKSDRLKEICANLEHLLRKDKVRKFYESIIDGSDTEIMNLHPETWEHSLSQQVIDTLNRVSPILRALSDAHIRVDLTTGQFRLTPRKDGEPINVHYPITGLSLNLEIIRHHYIDKDAVFSLYYTMGVIEAYCSLASLERRLFPVFVKFPSLEQSDRYVVALTKPADPYLLLNQERVVPNDYHFDAQTRGLVITGPNTGGKTVYGFTLPKLQVLAQAGAPIPLETGEMSVADYIFTLRPASKEQIGEGRYLHSLVRGREILEKATPRSLVCIDDFEGTDPEDCYKQSLIILRNLLRIGSAVTLTTQDRRVALEVEENKDGAYNGAVPVQLKCELTEKGVTFYYKVIPGVGKSIGEVCARDAGMDEASLDLLMKQREF
ncbi:hypothetical protein HY636_00795 [Candidatus Woesearchaeota archaeon]|nr:hypothetical protein [Candidatus Woesearchaeota archaeon]